MIISITANKSKTILTKHADRTRPKANSLYKGHSQKQMGMQHEIN